MIINVFYGRGNVGLSVSFVVYFIFIDRSDGGVVRSMGFVGFVAGFRFFIFSLACYGII